MADSYVSTDLLDVLDAEDQWVAGVDGRSAMNEVTLTELVDGSVQSEALQPSASSTTSVASTMKSTTTSPVAATCAAACGGTLPKWSQCGKTG